MSNTQARAIASVSVCVLGMVAMYLSDGLTGVGWAVLGLFFIWVE
jgi:hypothetical protein